MTKREKAIVRELVGQLAGALRGEAARQRVQVSADEPELRTLAETTAEVAAFLAEARDFIASLSQGRLDIEPHPDNPLLSPFAHLHAELRHLTWQTEQIAAGDFDQRIESFGAFADAFNSLIETLREKEKTEERLRYVSNHDALTELYNRSFFSEEIARIERGRRFPLSVIVADLDGLKIINDTLGHAAGDRLLQAAALVLRQAVRADDILARIGGDEFAVILPETDLNAAARVINRIREYEAAANLSGEGCRLSISLGVATAHSRGKLIDVFKLADERMYEDKLARKKGGC